MPEVLGAKRFRRRGIGLSLAGLGKALAGGAVTAGPAGLAASISGAIRSMQRFTGKAFPPSPKNL
jgi:hypothetical protein